MSDLPSKEELVEAGAKALRGISVGNWEDRVTVATAILDAILPLVMRGPVEALEPFAAMAVSSSTGPVLPFRVLSHETATRARSVRQWAEKIGGGDHG